MSESDIRRLEEEAMDHRDEVAAEADLLRERLQPGELAQDAMARVKFEAQRLREEATDQLEAAGDWVADHKEAVVGAGLAAVGAGLLYYLLRRRRRPVPVYKAYDVGDFEGVEREARRLWRRLKGEAEDATDEAQGLLARARKGARQKAREVEHSDLGHEAAHLGQRARVIADEAGDIAGEASKRAVDWTRRQGEEHPLGLLAGGLLVGALAAGLAAGMMSGSADDRDERRNS